MGTLDFGLHDILMYEMKNGEGKGGKYLEKEYIVDKEGTILYILHILHIIHILHINQI